MIPILEVRETGNDKHPWGVWIDGELWGWSKHRFDADFAKSFIELHGVSGYLNLLGGPR